MSRVEKVPYEIRYGRTCSSPIHWNEMGEMLYLDHEMVQGTIEIIRGWSLDAHFSDLMEKCS